MTEDQATLYQLVNLVRDRPSFYWPVFPSDTVVLSWAAPGAGVTRDLIASRQRKPVHVLHWTIYSSVQSNFTLLADSTLVFQGTVNANDPHTVILPWPGLVVANADVAKMALSVAGSWAAILTLFRE